MTIEIAYTLPHGYSACAGICSTGWYGGALVIEDRDAEFLKIPEDFTFDQRVAHARRWCKVTVVRHAKSFCCGHLRKG